jgi:hypothetical protein
MTNPSPRPPRRASSRRRRPLIAALLLPVVLSACSLRVGKDYQYNVEAGYRHNVVVSRSRSELAALLLRRTSPAVTAKTVADLIRQTWQLDRIYCPAGGIPGCDTTSEYTRAHPADLAGAIQDAHRAGTCLALTVLPPYNYTNKGRSHGCIG